MRTGVRFHFLMMFVYLGRVWTSETNVESVSSTKRTEVDTMESTNLTATTAVTVQSFRRPRYYRRGYNGMRNDDAFEYEDEQDDHHDLDTMDDHHHHHHHQEDMKAIVKPKSDFWNGYYDFLINEGSYKFWAVFQLATAALLIYSGFAALYYAKVNPEVGDDEFDDIFRRRRRRRRRGRSFAPLAASDRPFSGLDVVTFQRIIDAIAMEIH